MESPHQAGYPDFTLARDQREPDLRQTARWVESLGRLDVIGFHERVVFVGEWTLARASEEFAVPFFERNPTEPKPLPTVLDQTVLVAVHPGEIATELDLRGNTRRLVHRDGMADLEGQTVEYQSGAFREITTRFSTSPQVKAAAEDREDHRPEHRKDRGGSEDLQKCENPAFSTSLFLIAFHHRVLQVVDGDPAKKSGPLPGVGVPASGVVGSVEITVVEAHLEPISPLANPVLRIGALGILEEMQSILFLGIRIPGSEVVDASVRDEIDAPRRELFFPRELSEEASSRRNGRPRRPRERDDRQPVGSDPSSGKDAR